jgi:hypothetical protein
MNLGKGRRVLERDREEVEGALVGRRRVEGVSQV